jgi:hypothetical protein
MGLLSSPGLRGILGAAALAAAALSSSGCQSHADKIAAYREAWGAGSFEAAENELDNVIASESGASVEVVAKSSALDPAVNAASGNTYLLLLEKAMVRLARGDAPSCVKVLLKARDELDKHYESTFKDFFGSAMGDDESRAFAGADYEHIMVRVLLAVTDLLTGEGDAYAYALQVGEKQEEIINSPLGEEKQKYYPRKMYQRVAVGAYVQGVINESNLYASDARIAYERGLGYAGGSAGRPAGMPAVEAAQVAAASSVAQSATALLRGAMERAAGSRYAPDGCGVLHVFYLGGKGPHLEATTENPTAQAVALAAVGATLVTGKISQLGQAAVKVPKVVVSDWNVPPLPVCADGAAAAASTSTLLDVNLVARQQLDANMPGITARALVRRALKGAVGAGIEAQGSDMAKLFGFLFTAISTGVERAETRNWVSLPAQIQVARVPLGEGQHRVSFGPGMDTNVRVARGRDTYVIVLRPNLMLPGVILVDKFSAVAAPPPPPPAPPAGSPAAAPIPPPAPGATPAGVKRVP